MNKGLSIVITRFLIVGLAAVVVTLRLSVRVWITKKLWWDDWIILICCCEVISLIELLKKISYNFSVAGRYDRRGPELR